MTDHLSPAILNALADGELTAAQLDAAQQHLAACSSCTANALAQTMLKTATTKAGHRYTAPPHLRELLLRQLEQESSKPQSSQSRKPQRAPLGFGISGWAMALTLLAVCVCLFVLQHNARHAVLDASANYGLATEALATEAVDQHIATLAANAPPQVISSDRHTVKPWFQGKLPFSFNLPEDLPADITLEGANLTYIHNQPTALLLYSIGKHRVSVFVRQRTMAELPIAPLTTHSGFHVTGFSTPDLDVVAVSDVDPARLANLVQSIEQVLSGSLIQK